MANGQMSWIHDKVEQSSIKGVPYRVHSCSSYSKEFSPAKIIPNRPEDHTSRWSCQAGDSQPWLLLELNKPAVLCQVTIGKYKEDHPCNAQSIRILAGNDPSHLEEVLATNLRNDSNREGFELLHSIPVWKGNMATRSLWDIRRENDSIPFPVRFVKLLPGRAYEPRYNVSLWHIKFEGTTDTNYIERVQREWFQAQKLQKDRIVLKHLRYSSDLRPAFQSVLHLAQQSHEISTVLEHPALTRLFDQFVVNRDYLASEETLRHILEEGLVKEYQDLVPKRYSWRLLHNAGLEQPSVRGGHAMCAISSTLWLFGGNDGRTQLNDFWKGSLKGDTLSWARIQRKENSWPAFGGRKLMAATEDRIYLIALAGMDGAHIPTNESFGLVTDELAETVVSTEGTLCGEGANDAILWAYDVGFDRWEEIGRRRWDRASQTLSSFSYHDGRLIVGITAGQTYSVATYNIGSGMWTESLYGPTPMFLESSAMPCTPRRPLLADCFDSINERQVLVSTRPVSLEYEDCTLPPVETVHAPTPCSTGNVSRRAFIDFQGTSLLLLTGAKGDCLIPSKSAQTAIHVYSIPRGDWQEMIREDGFDLGLADSTGSPDQLSLARECGHAMTYDKVTGRCIFYGGRTDGLAAEGNVAVELELHGLRETDILRKCQRIIRRQSFLQILLQRSPLEALSFLQETLSPVSAPSDPEEQQDLKSLFTTLVRGPKGKDDAMDSGDYGDSAHLAAFQQLLHYISPRFKEPFEEITSHMML